MARFEKVFGLNKLNEINGMTREQVHDWLFDLDLDRVEVGIENMEDFHKGNEIIYVDGARAKKTPIIEIKNGKVIRWYKKEEKA